MPSGAPPPDFDGRSLAAAHRAAAKLDRALAWRKTIPAHATTCDDLSDALSTVTRAPFVAFIHPRLRDLLAVTRLWLQAERLPPETPAARLVRVELIDTPRWRADLVDALVAAGLDKPE